MQNAMNRGYFLLLSCDFYLAQRRPGRDSVQQRGACSAEEWDAVLSRTEQERERISMLLPSSLAASAFASSPCGTFLVAASEVARAISMPAGSGMPICGVANLVHVPLS